MRGKAVERIVRDGRTYEVRRDGEFLCLYAEGVLHTAFDETNLISGRIWDLLAMPAIALGSRRVLALGVGGGAALRQMLELGQVTSLDGVDLDEVHLGIAGRHFGLDDRRVKLHHADARTFVDRSRATYDCIIEDVFAENHGIPLRAIRLDREWADELDERLADDGVLVVNHAGKHELRASALADESFRSRFATILSLETSTAGNVVIALFRKPMDARSLRTLTNHALGERASRLDVEIRVRR